MKKLYALLIAFFTILSVNAQYRCIPDLTAHGNPGNASYEETPQIQLTLLRQSNIPRWSQVIDIPFPFYFNGQLVTSLKASTTGVVTFDTTVAWVPPAGNAPLPSPLMTDKSICIWGIQATNSYAEMQLSFATNNQGTVPCRQMWITFSQYNDDLAPNTSLLSTRSIVIEENTNNIYVVIHRDNTTEELSMTIGVQIDQNNACMAPSSPYLNYQVGRNFYGGNNSYLTFLPQPSINFDGTIESSLLYDYIDISDAPFNPGIEFRNVGSDTVNSVDVYYSINGGAEQTENFSGLNILSGARTILEFSAQWTPSDTGLYNFNYRIGNINGSVDDDTTNNHFLQDVYVAPQLPKRRVLFEEFKGTWCMHSGTWTAKYDSVLNANSSKVSSLKYESTPISWISDVYDRGRFYKQWCTPSSYVNGKLLQNDSLCDANYMIFPGCPWNAVQSDIDKLYNMPGLFSVVPKLNIDGYTATISGTITSLVPIKNPCRIYISVIEDSIFYDTPQGSSGESLFVNTSRKLFPDKDGIFIGTPVFGQVDSVNFNFTITDTTSDITRMRVIIFVQDTITKEIFQCEESPAIINCMPAQSSTIYYDLCTDDSVFVNGTWVSYNGNRLENVITNNVSSAGCDSLHYDAVRFHVLTVGINKVNNKLQAAYWGYGWPTDTVTFNWVDSLTGQILPGETTNTLLPPYSGYFYLRVSNQYGCSTNSTALFAACAYSNTSTNTINYNLCPGDSVLVNGEYINTSRYYWQQILTNSHGCDSILTITVYSNASYPSVTNATGFGLTVSPATYQSYQWYDCNTGSLIAGATNSTLIGDSINGGNYYCQTVNASGCISNTSCVSVPAMGGIINTQVLEICEGDSIQFGQNWYETNGFYYDTIPNGSGSDLIYLTEISHYDLNTDLTLNGNTISAQSGFVSYTWIDCQSGFAVIGQSSSTFTPTATGNYKVIVESAEGCIDSSECIQVILNSISTVDDDNIQVWPNPANSSFSIAFSEKNKFKSVTLTDVIGNVIEIEVKNETTFEIETAKFPSGIYLLNIKDATEKISRKKIIIAH